MILKARSALALVLCHLVVTAVTVNQAHSADLTWGGTYRIEALKVKNPELGGGESNKAYGLHHLILTPKIVAGDGLTIYSRFDLLNNSSLVGGSGRVNSLAGDFLGNGPGELPDRGGAATTDQNNSNVLGRTQRATPIQVTSLYATWTQEFGQLIVGRSPFHFGLGINYNAGNGMFDHFIDTKDMVGYKVVLGNLSVLPIIAKGNEGVVGEEDDVNDYIIQVQYENPETELSLGILYQIRNWTYAGNDYPNPNTNSNPADPTPNPGAGTRGDGGNSNLVSLFSSQKAGDFTIGFEANFLSGDTGLRTPGGAGISQNSYGIAAELGWRPTDSKFLGGLKAGFASGDDPGTAEVYEGFTFNRNYDVAMLLFNHPLGQYNVLRTQQARSSNNPVRNEIDTEALSNAIYVAPNLQYQWKENLSYGGTLTYAMVNKDPIAGGSTATDLGFELDLNVTYKPYERLTWITEVAALMPGGAWKGSNTLQFDNKFAYGVMTRAAISF